MNKKRNWAFVMYPESMPINAFETLQQTGLEIAISPLHDKDINSTGEIKKPHYHIILCYPGPTTYDNVKRLTDSLNSTIPQPLESCKGYYRYLTHKDNPEKTQYNESDIKLLNGFDVLELMNSSEINHIKKWIIEFIRDNNIIEYSDLLDLLVENELYQEFQVASSHTILFNTYISSKRNKKAIDK